jgi:hypothetical protein
MSPKQPASTVKIASAVGGLRQSHDWQADIKVSMSFNFTFPLKATAKFSGIANDTRRVWWLQVLSFNKLS